MCSTGIDKIAHNYIQIFDLLSMKGGAIIFIIRSQAGGCGANFLVG